MSLSDPPAAPDQAPDFPENDPPLLPGWFREKIFAILVVSMLVMQALADQQGSPDLLYVWFATGLPLAFLGASAWHWLARPKPRRGVGEILGIWKRALLRSPGMSILYAGLIPTGLVFAAQVGIKRDLSAFQEDLLSTIGMGVFGLAAVVSVGAWLLRSRRSR
jgi:hypothetical protein